MLCFGSRVNGGVHHFRLESVAVICPMASRCPIGGKRFEAKANSRRTRGLDSREKNEDVAGRTHVT